MAEKSVASSKSGTKPSYIVQEKTGFEKLSAEIKDSVFQVLYLILKEEDGSFIGFMIEMGADYLQMGAFCFEDKINGIWKASEFLEFVFKLFSFFQIQTYFSEAFTFTSYLVSFYICIAAITLVVINILYVSIAFSKKRVTAIWPVTVLRAVTGLFFTVFFLPITELLISMLECDYDANGDYVQTKYPEIKCWQGSHIIHATIAILVIIIFVILGFIVALAYFEIRMQTEDITARQHSRGDVVFISNKILLQLAFSFLSEEQEWILVLMIAIGACVLWRSFNMDEPYYRKDATLFFKIVTTYYLWTALLLFSCKVLEESTFDGGLIVWVVGIPFIGVIIYTSSKSKSQSLSKGTSRFKTSSDLMDHLRYLLQLIDNYDSDKNARILLSGYVEKHRDTCDEEDCPLKINRRKKVTHGSDPNEISIGLTLVVDRMYQAGLKKFKSSAKLRIAYGVFLLERMKKMKKAEQELAKAQELKPGFEDQFVIFRLTKMISDGMEGVDVVGLIAWDNYKNLYQEFVTESANLHKEFWSELREDTPNLKKLSYLGSRVNAAMSQASEYWNRVQKVRPDDPIILKTYGRFLIDIQNDVVEGYDLIEKSKKLVKKIIYHQYAKRSSFDAGLDNLPYVEVVGSGQDMGTIKQANLLFTVLAGVNRDEIVEKKINIFMPDLFSQYHDTFLKRFNNREEDYDIGYLDNDNSLFIRSRSGYIIPVTLRVSRIKTEETTNQIVFGAWFRTETAKRTYVHFLCSKDGAIMDMSASAVTILNLSPANVKKSKMTIDKIVPNALTDKGYREGGKEISFKVNESSTIYFIATITPIVLKDDKNMDFITQYAIQNPGHPLTVTDKSYGYIVKLDKLEKSGDGTHNGILESSKLSTDRRRKRDTVQSSYERENSIRSDPSRPSKMDNLEGEPTKKEEDGQIIWGFNTDYAELEISELFQNDGAKLDINKLVKQDTEVEREKKDYGQGINLKKFIQGYLYEIHEESEAPINLDDDEEGSLFNKKDDDDDGIMNKKRKDKLSSLKRLVRDALEANQRNSAVTPIRWLTFGWLLMIFAISILQYVLLNSLFNNYGNRIHVVRSFVEKLTEIDLINSYITDFMVFDAFPNLETDYPDANLDARKKGVRDCVTRIVDLTSELEEDQYYSFLKSYIYDPVTITIYGAGGNDQFTLNETEALFFIASRAYNLLNLYEGSFNTSNREVLSVISNFYNVILPALRETTNEMKAKLTGDLGTFEYQFILLFVANGIIALLISIWGMILLLVIDQQKEDILFLFLEIPPSNIDSISRKREKFTDFFDTAIRQLQNNPEENHNQEENTESDASLEEKNHANLQGSVFDDSLKNGTFKSRDPNSLDAEEDALKDRKKLIKKFKSKKFIQARNGVIKVILLIIVSVAYSISISVTVVVAKSKVSQYCSQFFTTNLLSDSILSAINANRLMRLDGDFVIEGQTALQTGVESLWDLNTLGSNLGDFFLYVISKNNALETEITTLFFGNACDILDSGNSTVQANCEESLSNALKSGLFNLKEQVFKILMKEYTIFKNTSTTTEDDQLQLFYLNDDFKAYTFNILQNFNSNEEDFLNSILDSAVSLQEILLSIYLVLTALMLLILWMPYLSRLNAEVWRTTRMINMIPLDVVNNIPSIKRFLKNIVRASTE